VTVDPTVSEGGASNARRRSDEITAVVVRHVDAEMSGRPVQHVYRVLNARLHAAEVALDSELVQEHARAISDGTWAPRGY
jgi:hypothetical protein